MSVEKVLNEIFDIYLTEQIMEKVYENYQRVHRHKMKKCLRRLKYVMFISGRMYRFTKEDFNKYVFWHKLSEEIKWGEKYLDD